MADFLTLAEAAACLRFRSPRASTDWLRAHPLGLDDAPLCTRRGHDRLFSKRDLARIAELERAITAAEGPRCRSSSSRHGRARAQTSACGARTSASMLTRA